MLAEVKQNESTSGAMAGRGSALVRGSQSEADLIEFLASAGFGHCRGRWQTRAGDAEAESCSM